MRLGLTTQKAAELMRSGGKVVLIGSIAGDLDTKGKGVDGATKAAVRGIRVDVVSPGATDTPMLDAVTDEVRAVPTGMTPLCRHGRPEEVAAAVNFHAGPESSFVTGAELCVDGGMAQV